MGLLAEMEAVSTEEGAIRTAILKKRDVNTVNKTQGLQIYKTILFSRHNQFLGEVEIP